MCVAVANVTANEKEVEREPQDKPPVKAIPIPPPKTVLPELETETSSETPHTPTPETVSVEPEIPVTEKPISCVVAAAKCASNIECLSARATFRVACHRTPFFPSYCNKECVDVSRALIRSPEGRDLYDCTCGDMRFCDFLDIRSNHCLW